VHEALVGGEGSDPARVTLQNALKSKLISHCCCCCCK
jgi:hypothetical protein